jgi:hypothetical protein
MMLLLPLGLMAGTVRLANDSAFQLRAVIRAADGTYLGEMLVSPQQTMQWNDYWGGVGVYNLSRTPYVVTWYCTKGGDFSVCEGVPTGGTVTAMTCAGARQCQPKQPENRPPLYGPSTEQYMENGPNPESDANEPPPS